MVAASEVLNSVFQALANPTRRAVVERLGRGPATVSELAEPFDMALPSFLQHLRVLEDSGLVRSRKKGRVRTLRIVPERIERVTDWLSKQHALWEQRLNQLDEYLNEMNERKECNE